MQLNKGKYRVFNAKRLVHENNPKHKEINLFIIGKHIYVKIVMFISYA